jgi:hypothetical protein
MKVCYTILISLLTGTLSSNAQTSWTIEGHITDNATGQPLGGAYIAAENTKCATTSDKNGSYRLLCTTNADTLVVEYRAMNYQRVVKTIQKQDTQRNFVNTNLNIELIFHPIELPVVDISSGPRTVWGSEFLHVADYAFLETGMILLTYEKELMWKKQEDASRTFFTGCRLVLLDKDGMELSRRMISETCEDLYTGYLDEVFLRTRYNVYHISSYESYLRFTKMDNSDFKNGILTVIDTIGYNTYFSNYDETFPEFQYMIFNRNDSTYKTFRKVIDEEMMRMLRSEYKYLDGRGKVEALKYELRTGVDKEIVAAYMRGFQRSNYYQKLNAPLLVSNDTLMLFDHHHNKLLRFDWTGQALDSISIDYHKIQRPDKWNEELFKDKRTNHIYTTSTRNGYTHIYRINTTTGKKQHLKQLTYRYCSNLRIHDGWVYYIYRPYEDIQKRYLYKEQL